MNTKEFEGTKGITLIALIISILILLILAGVTLQLAVGEDGIIGRAIVAREQHEEAEEKEKLELAVSAAMVDGKGELTTENLNKELREQFGNEEEVKPTSVGWSYNGNKRYRIYNDGKVEHIIFQPVEYIESTGTQYIDTKYIPKTNTELRLEISFSGNFNAADDGRTTIFQAMNNDRAYIFALNFGGESSQSKQLFAWINKTWGGTLDEIQSFTINNQIKNNKNLITMKSGKITYGTFSRTLFEKTVDNDRSLFLLGNRSSNGNIVTFKAYNAKVYSLKLLEGDDLKRDFLPCYTTTTVTDVDGKTCPSGTIGLYDLVEDQFYTNQGTGEFLKGEDV